jgi:hypothetical protein
MLELELSEKELYDEETNQFVYTKPITLRLEHSLVSLSKWEAKWKTPFLSNKNLTNEQAIDYIKCMTITQNVDDNVYKALNQSDLKKIEAYISEEQTATTFAKTNEPPNRQVITSELIYFWMASYNIPMECQKWHLSRLLTLIRIASIKNQPEKKMSKNAILNRNKSLNAARRKAMHSKG